MSGSDLERSVFAEEFYFLANLSTPDDHVRVVLIKGFGHLFICRLGVYDVLYHDGLHHILRNEVVAIPEDRTEVVGVGVAHDAFERQIDFLLVLVLRDHQVQPLLHFRLHDVDLV